MRIMMSRAASSLVRREITITAIVSLDILFARFAPSSCITATKQGRLLSHMPPPSTPSVRVSVFAAAFGAHINEMAACDSTFSCMISRLFSFDGMG